MKDEKKVEQNKEFEVEFDVHKEDLDKMEPWDWVSAIKEAKEEAVKEGIKANRILINSNSRLMKINPFALMYTPQMGCLYPPMICGLEVFLSLDMPEEFAFAITEAPKTERERLIEDLKAENHELRVKLSKKKKLYEKLHLLHTERCNIKGKEYTRFVFRNGHGALVEETYMHDSYYGENNDIQGEIYAERRRAEIEEGEDE